MKESLSSRLNRRLRGKGRHVGDAPIEPRSWSREIRAGEGSAAEARWFLLDVLEDRGLDVDTALLLTSEIATNAVRHGREPVELSISLETEGLRVSVVDRGQGFDPNHLEESDEPSGWGLKLVDDLSTDWGVNRTKQGTEVWFRI